MATAHVLADMATMIAFIGECTAATGAFAAPSPRRSAGAKCVAVATEAGANAVPIVLLIGFLMGVIIAFEIAVVAQKFGAVIFVVNGVGVAMLRELGALMTAIVFAGRTGAAFAAQIGTQKVNEEVNAIVTFGLDPVRFLVLPRLLAAAVVMPLLTVLADVIGLFGGALVMLSFDVSFVQFYNQLLGAVDSLRLRPRPRQGGRVRAGDRRDRLPARARHRRRRGLGGPARRPARWSPASCWIVVIDGLFAVLVNRWEASVDGRVRSPAAQPRTAQPRGRRRSACAT